MPTWVVLPTYNERPNLEPMVTKLFQHPDLFVLVVDDHSPDGTGQLAETLRSRWPRLAVLHRPEKTGLGPAYRQGLSLALDRGATKIIHLDADQSHDPELIPAMINQLGTTELVVASRYVPGGAIRIPWYRQVISLVGNWYLRRLLGPELHDWSSGYCAWRAGILRQVLAQPAQTVGYACLIEMKWQAKRLLARMVEVPLMFRDRQHGQSKFSWPIMWEDLRTAWRLRRST